MIRQLTLKFNLFNDAIRKGVLQGEFSYVLELIVDGESHLITFDDYYDDNFHCTKKIPIEAPEEGIVTLGCVLHFTAVGEKTYRYIFPHRVVDLDKENLFTFNMYGYRYNERDLEVFDFGPGEIPERPKKKGCYVATCVYGSYDCPEVWTLRRFRDDTLSATWYGRLFIRTYYAISPTLVKWFGNAIWFQKAVKPRLDKLVERLNKKGVSDKPYEDEN